MSGVLTDWFLVLDEGLEDLFGLLFDRWPRFQEF
jgi:hypothetical protein